MSWSLKATMLRCRSVSYLPEVPFGFVSHLSIRIVVSSFVFIPRSHGREPVVLNASRDHGLAPVATTGPINQNWTLLEIFNELRAPLPLPGRATF
jgi:hypothetical protein